MSAGFKNGSRSFSSRRGRIAQPLGEDFDSRDLIKALRAIPIVACPNRLGAVNQARLVLAALPPDPPAAHKSC